MRLAAQPSRHHQIGTRGRASAATALWDVGGSIATKRALTWAEFLAAGKEGQRWEYVDGEVTFMSPPMGGNHYTAVMKICLEANRYASQHPEWMSVHTDVAFTMASGNLRCPDWALVRRERFGEGGMPEGAVPFPPDVAFEVISASESGRPFKGSVVST